MIRLPTPSRSDLGQRVLWALLIIFFVAGLVFADRSGYRDSSGGEMSFLDALYYSTVSVTTTGYGDVVPETDRARWITILFVTPARVIFLILLLGTTLELLFGKMRKEWQRDRWRKRIGDHYLIVGYGVKGKAASKRLIDHGTLAKNIVAIDHRREEILRANEWGIVGIEGDGSDREVLQQAAADKARTILLALDSDDHTLLATLRARELSEATIVATCRDEQNAEPLRRAGASRVIVSAGAAGRLLGLAGETPATSELLEDILDPQGGFDILEKDGPAGEDEILLAVIQDGQVHRWPHFGGSHRKAGDRVIVLRQAD